MRLLEIFDNPAVPARYTFIFDAINQDGLYVALELSEDGYDLSQWTTERYEPGGDNTHIGYPILLRELGDARPRWFLLAAEHTRRVGRGAYHDRADHPRGAR